MPSQTTPRARPPAGSVARRAAQLTTPVSKPDANDCGQNAAQKHRTPSFARPLHPVHRGTPAGSFRSKFPRPSPASAARSRGLSGVPGNGGHQRIEYLTSCRLCINSIYSEHAYCW